MSDDEYEEVFFWDPMQGSQANSADPSVVHLAPLEDAQFSQQQNIDIQDRLTFINRRIALANIALAHLREKLGATDRPPPIVRRVQSDTESDTESDTANYTESDTESDTENYTENNN